MNFFYDLIFFIVSNLRIPFVKTISMGPELLSSLENSLKHGDLIFGHRKGYLKNLLVPGEFQHVGVFDFNRKCILEMQDDGGAETPLIVFLNRYTKIGVYRPEFTTEYSELFVKNMRLEVVKPYDRHYSLNVQSTYCSESVFRSDSQGLLKYEPEKWFWLWVFMPNTIAKLKTVRRICTIEFKNGGLIWNHH
jgi:hypothetical protein